MSAYEPPRYETLALEVDEDGVATLTLSRPESLNAFDLTMAAELRRFFETDAYDDAIRAVVVTGAGRAFCAGMDLSAEGNVFGLDETLWEGSRSMFFWTLESVARRTELPGFATTSSSSRRRASTGSTSRTSAPTSASRCSVFSTRRSRSDRASTRRGWSFRSKA